MTDAIMTEARSPARTLGAIASMSVVLIWAAWLVSTRYSIGHASSLTVLDLSLIRYGVPAVVLSPFWLRTGLWPKNVPKIPLVLMIAGSGAVFFQIVAFGLRHTPASAAGVLLPGAMPFFTAMIGILFLGERPDFSRRIGLAAILGGGLILLVGSMADHPLSWVSYTVLPVGATCWAIYTHAFKRTGLSAFEGGALICVWSTIINLAALPFVGTGLFDASLHELAMPILTQGILSGLLATIFYGIGVRILGGTQAAAYTAITPVAAALAGGWLLAEPVGLPIMVAALVTGLGVLLSTGILSRRKA